MTIKRKPTLKQVFNAWLKYQKKHSEAYKIDVFELIKDEKFNIPETITEIPKNALLDTTRNYFEQIKKYKEFDIRWDVTPNNEKEHHSNHHIKIEKLEEKSD